MSVAPRIVAGALLVSCMTLNTSASTIHAQGNTERELIAMEHKWIDATIKGDVDAFASFMAEG